MEGEYRIDLDSIRMRPASNGYIICYTEICKPCGCNVYDNCQYNYKEVVFDKGKGKEALAMIDQLFSANEKEK